MRVLVVEDEVFFGQAIAKGLQRAAMAVDLTHDGQSALDLLALNDYDVMVLDRDLPVVHGDEVCRQTVIRHPGTRVLMLTAARLLDDKVSGFELGADDYLAKPFEFPELIARLRALGRRTQPGTPPVLEVGGIRLDPFRHEVYRAGRFVRLSLKEFAVLEVLMRADGGVVSAETLLAQGWDENADPFTNAIRITISTLRRRLGQPWVIQTVKGAGYRMGGFP